MTCLLIAGCRMPVGRAGVCSGLITGTTTTIRLLINETGDTMGWATPAAEDDDGRDESPNQRMDRNWIELLQELRVTQMGVQILGGFLLTLAFQARFEDLDGFQRGLYVGLVVFAATTILAGMAPVYLHRALFRMGLKPSIVTFGHAAVLAQLVSVATIVVGTMLLVLDVTVGLRPAIAAAAALTCFLIAVALAPVVIRRRQARKPAVRPSTAAAPPVSSLPTGQVLPGPRHDRC
jgi:MFS family permease